MQDMGINKLANMFMGNPQPLAQKVQQAQQQTKPGQIPPDLEQAIALQKIQEMHNAAQNQQAMQAGGPQPTVVDRLRQMLQQQPQSQAQPEGVAPPPMQHPMAQAQPQAPQGIAAAQPQGVPQMPQVQAAHGGSIAQLMSNLGRHYGGGGIVAFNGEDDSYVNQRDNLRRMEAAYNPSMTAGLTGGTETQPLAQLGQTEAERMRLERMRQDPEALAAAKEARFESQVGGPNLDAERALMEELKAKRAKAQENVSPLMDWARGVAGARPGQKWWQSGLAGSEYADRMAAQRESADTAFLKEILGQQSKIGEAERGYKMSKFTLGEAERNRIYNETLEALKAQGVAEDAAKKMAQDVVLQKERLASEESMAADRNKLQAAANANTAAYHTADLALKGRQADLAELTKPTADDIIFNRVMGRVNQDPEIKILAKRLQDDEPGSDTYRQTQKMMHEKMKTHFSQHPNLLPPLTEMADMAEPLAKPKSFEEKFKEMGGWGWYPGKSSAAKSSGTVSFDQLPK